MINIHNAGFNPNFTVKNSKLCLLTQKEETPMACTMWSIQCSTIPVFLEQGPFIDIVNIKSSWAITCDKGYLDQYNNSWQRGRWHNIHTLFRPRE